MNAERVLQLKADGKPWFCMLEEEADDMVQKNNAKKFATEETDDVYVERYCF